MSLQPGNMNIKDEKMINVTVWKETALLTIREKLEELCDIRVVIVISLNQNAPPYRHHCIARPSFHGYRQRPEEHFIHLTRAVI